MENNENILLTRDKNSFNLLRLLAATGVTVTHSYALVATSLCHLLFDQKISMTVYAIDFYLKICYYNANYILSN
jgi:hypothetical protein